MSTSPSMDPPQIPGVRPQRAKRLQPTRYDRASAALIAALILTGTTVLMLFIVWASSRVWTTPLAVDAELIEPPAGGGNAMGTARDLVEPGEEEVEDLTEPELEQTLDTVTDALSDQLATLDSLGGEAVASTKGGGAGDSRQPGPGGADSNLIPRHQRWQVLFTSSNLESYAKQIDFFGIELAAVGGAGATIDYAAGFSNDIQRRAGTPRDENRMYLTWQYGPLRNADVALLQKAEIATQGRILMQFLPAKVENRLANLEKRYCEAKQTSLEKVQRTVFGVKGTRGGYEFYVKEIQTRSGGRL